AQHPTLSTLSLHDALPIFLKKTNVSAAIEKDAKSGEVKVFARPGYLIGGEISKLVDRGYQKFLKTTKTEVPATADHLKAIHQFRSEEHTSELQSLRHIVCR